MTRVLVCGSRDWKCAILADRLVRRLKRRYGLKLVVVHGACATGIDAVVDRMCRRYAVAVERFPADWEEHGAAAGPLRNQAMVDTRPDFAVACHQGIGYSKGTRDCVERCLASGVRVYLINHRDAEPRLVLGFRGRAVLIRESGRLQDARA